ncbi:MULTISPECIES: hypothetical protein [Xanthomonas translucens group]|uniref:Uncharacterized protein n=1 Tax=Xanthomonas cerealis pv. cerealis TaxID=152263 RepID=A0A514E992_9XANT|nr:hypothetical protein [Xanthomonas translucens]QDI02581.1 hypothetical protein E4A48_01680 [Xanthomonas translucens pv. cerealis]UKE47965.1 hypothetical protein KHA79_04650 [Xanthomonas translucens pv. cerealis]UKE70359.1 hypothetical protein K8O61_04735 [Xanthomonas translucens pv. pistacia]
MAKLHAVLVVGDADPGVQVAQRLDHEATMAQFGLGVGRVAGGIDGLLEAAFAQRLPRLQLRRLDHGADRWSESGS